MKLISGIYRATGVFLWRVLVEVVKAFTAALAMLAVLGILTINECSSYLEEREQEANEEAVE